VNIDLTLEQNQQLNMVNQQIRSWDVLEQSILELILSVPRKPFVLNEYQASAYCDDFLPIGFEQLTLPPNIVGRLLQSLNLDPRETILEVGTGTGYLTTLLCQLAYKIISVEIIRELSYQAKTNLRTFNRNNVQLEVGDGVCGWPSKAPFDAIVLTGSVPVLPKALREQLSINGRLFAIVGTAPVMTAFLITRLSQDRFREQALFETAVPALINAPSLKPFHFN
jgi:protein-L-isoaspartate(D-aspartate) O-methyltransferase